MSKYTIPCSKEQIEISLKLGAEEEYLTAEEMIGWLEEQKIFVHIAPCVDISCSYHIASKGYNKYGYTSNIMVCKTRKEATLAAIDAALEYLSNNKK